MIGLVRLLRVALILVLALLTLSFVVALGTPSTGWVEKAALVGLVAGCVYLAARISTIAIRLEARLQRPASH